MEIRKGFAGTVGNTPLIELPTLSAATGCRILAKAEHLNPGGSVKDRAAKYMIEAAERSGELQKGGTIVEATAGNTGIGLVYVANSKGYKSLFVIPDKMAVEKIKLLRTLGATVEVVPTVSIDHPDHFAKVAERRSKEIGGFFVNQFGNVNNYLAHYETTGPEIWRQTNGEVDTIVMSTGTGGTFAGCSAFLKEKNRDILCYIIEPQSCGIRYVKDENGIHFVKKTEEEKQKENKSTVLEGVGSSAVYVPLSYSKVDGVLAGNDQIAFEMAHYLLKKEGLFVGPTGAMNVVGALWMAKMLGPNHTIVTVLCDGGNNTRDKVYNDKWLAANNISIQRTEPQQFLDAFDSSKIVISV